MQPLIKVNPAYRLVSAPRLLFYCFVHLLTCSEPIPPIYGTVLCLAVQFLVSSRSQPYGLESGSLSEHWLQCRTWETLSDLNGADKSFHSAQKPERAWRVPTRLSPAWSPSVSTHKRGPRLRGRTPGIKLSSAVAVARIHMDIKGSDAGLCVGNSDAQGIT